MTKFKPENRNCKTCNDVFWAIRDWHRFCSSKCRIADWRIDHPTVTPDVIEDIEKIKEKLGMN